MGNSSISDEHVFFVALHFTTREFHFSPIAIQFYFWQKSSLTLSIQLHFYRCKTADNFADNSKVAICINRNVLIFAI
ncbi:hypothetical protein EA458_10955 [Streptococcus dysgalactiae subsp. dysgalactiae]|nr:hypothetical protein EA458_10955 [Streptococcus dysgalactiae subsp. dysgalactiae]